jgi:hypothetical protein
MRVRSGGGSSRSISSDRSAHASTIGDVAPPSAVIDFPKVEEDTRESIFGTAHTCTFSS